MRGIGFQFAAQVVDMDVNGALNAVIDAQVRGLKQLHPAEHLSGMLHQHIQQAELSRREGDDLPRDDTLLRRNVKHDVAKPIGFG